jgi:hypothetical protein
MAWRAVRAGWIRQREQQMALQAHLSGGAQVEDADQADRDRSDLIRAFPSTAA